MKVLWLRPSKGENISVRRERIAELLRSQGYEIEIRDASGLDAIGAIKEALIGDYDVIAGNVRVGLYLGYPLAQFLRTPFLGDVSDPITDIEYLPDILFRVFRWYEWQVLKRADTTVFVYESSYREAIDRGIHNATKLPNAVNYDLFAEPDQKVVEEAESILMANNVKLERPIAIYIGVFSPRYCIKTILKAAEYCPKWEFVFIGEGKLESQVQKAADEADNVYFPGAFPYQLMPGFLSLADVGFCFKDAEQPLKLKEYGAAGLPIIVRPGELSKWYDEDELLVVDPDPRAIAKQLNELDADTELYQKYSEAGRAISSEWTWEEIAEEYDQLFRKIQKVNKSN